jgi:hypothetical protein
MAQFRRRPLKIDLLLGEAILKGHLSIGELNVSTYFIYLPSNPSLSRQASLVSRGILGRRGTAYRYTIPTLPLVPSRQIEAVCPQSSAFAFTRRHGILAMTEHTLRVSVEHMASDI